jgi:peptidoglycan hydrolase CwlO-like protein
MTTFEIIQLFIGSGGLIGVILLFFQLGKFAQKIDAIDQRIEEFKKDTGKNFLEVKCEIKEMKHSINALEIQLGRLETRVEERTLRVVQPNYGREPAVR